MFIVFYCEIQNLTQKNLKKCFKTSLFHNKKKITELLTNLTNVELLL